MSRADQKVLFDIDPSGQEAMPWERAAEADRLAAEVVFNRPLDTVFHYLIPDSLRGMLEPGQRVEVPFGRGNRTTVGFCVGVVTPPETKRRLKWVDAVIDQEPLLSAKMLDLTRWIADRYLCSWGQVLESVVPAGVKKRAGTRVITFFLPAEKAREQLSELKLSPKQRGVLEFLIAATEPARADEIRDAVGCGMGPIHALRDKGLIEAVKRRAVAFVPESPESEPSDDLVLNHDQQPALDAILSSLQAGKHETFLLHGVTGSGKTEVYIQAIREVVSYGRQAIVLVPEISLTPQTIRRFRSRFDSVAVLHSHLSDAERHWHWLQIAGGAVQVVVGARSAIFAPTPHLGLIVIDEEHETTFKQDTAPRYHAREVAQQRAEMEHVPLILGTATPTLESWLRVKQNKDTLLSLPKRVEKLPMPPVVVVDIRNDPQCSQGGVIGRALGSSIRTALIDGGQIILFLNLRGYAPVLWCRACGQSVKCPRCDVTLTFHRDRDAVVCHSCDFEAARLKLCPSCNQAGIRYLGSGTQRLEQEVRSKFPGVNIARMDSDSMRKPGSHAEVLDRFRHGEVQILLGTQMIAKGLDFPNVTLVGVVDADTILHQPDLRASERTFQLISQVAGRTGRSTRGGRVFVQTSSPTEPAIVLAAEHNYQGFAERELAHRREANTPPYRRLARIILRSEDDEKLKRSAKNMAEHLRQAGQSNDCSIAILGPARAPIAKLKGQYRYHLQISAAEFHEIKSVWKTVQRNFTAEKGVEYIIDVDPINMR